MMGIAERGSRYGEAAVWRLWEAAWRGRVTTADGQRLRVLYPGRRNGGPGPDFRDALLVTSGGCRLLGDVEVHTTQGGWRAHGHHRDATYNGVQLHVVLRPRGAQPVPLELGVEVPTVVVQGAEGLGAPDAIPFPCHDAMPRLGERRVVEALERAGDARFQEKSRRFRLRLAHAPADEVMYQGLMEALGYAANREPFRRLALLLPFARLRRQALAQAGRERLPWLSSALLAASGLGDEGDVRRSGQPPLLTPEEWRRAGLRPSNHPRRRLRGAALLLHRFLPTGLMDGLLPLALKGGVAPLLDALTVSGESGPALVGRGRALDMATNVVLPALHALAVRRPGVREAALRLFRTLPSLEENDLTREVRRRALGGAQKGPRLSARGQQGLLHLYQRRCRWLACGGCPLAAHPGTCA